MRLRWALSLGLGLIILGCTFVHWLSALFADRSLYVSVKHLNVGKVLAANNIQFELPITNMSRTPVRISHFISSCGCVAIEPTSLYLPANETRQVNLTVDLINRSRSDGDSFSIDISPITESGVPIGPWTLTGTIRQVFEYDDKGIYFGDVPIGGRSTLRHISIQLLEPIEDFWTELSGLPLELVQIRFENNSPNCYVITAELMPSEQAGPFKGTVLLNGLLGDGSVISGIPLPIEGRFVGTVQLGPDELSFGVLEIGSVADSTISVFSNSGHEVTIEGIDIPPDEGLSVSITASRNDQELHTLVCEVSQIAVKVGAVRTQVVVTAVCSGTGQRQMIPLPITYYGTTTKARNIR